MALVAPGTLVAAPPRVGLPFGLNSIISWRPATADRWESGVDFETTNCSPLNGRNADCVTPLGLPKVVDFQPGLGEATPFIVYGGYECNPIGNSLEYAQEQATAHLLAREEAGAERALWLGELGSIPNFVGANGFPAPVSAGTHDTAVAALAAVEYGIGEEYGSLGVIHLSRRTATLLAKYLESRGGRLYTRALGTPVVAGAGYPDVPDIIGTPAMFGYRSEIFTNSAIPGDLLDRSLNILYGVAERTYLIGFDPCPIVKATYTGEVVP